MITKLYKENNKNIIDEINFDSKNLSLNQFINKWKNKNIVIEKRGSWGIYHFELIFQKGDYRKINKITGDSIDEVLFKLYNVLNKENLQLEFNRMDILKGIDKSFVNHQNYYNDLRQKIGVTNLVDSKDWYLQRVDGNDFFFNIRSATDKNKMYVNQVSFIEPFKWLKDNFNVDNYDLKDNKQVLKIVKDLKYYFRNVIDTDDIEVWCQCPNFKYRYQYVADQLGINVRDKPENRPAKIRNADERGLVCKHLNYTLKMISDNRNKSKLSEYLVDEFLSSLFKNKEKFWRYYFNLI